MENILNYESKRNIIYQKIFESTNLKRSDIHILYFLQANKKNEISLKAINEILSYIPPAEVSTSISKLYKKGYLNKTRPPYDERTLIINEIDYDKIAYTIELCKNIFKSQISAT